jgi:hypothetical protein
MSVLQFDICCAVIANEVKQSMTPECMDCHAAEAARNDDFSISGSWSICSSGHPKQGTRNDGFDGMDCHVPPRHKGLAAKGTLLAMTDLTAWIATALRASQ